MYYEKDPIYGVCYGKDNHWIIISLKYRIITHIVLSE